MSKTTRIDDFNIEAVLGQLCLMPEQKAENAALRCLFSYRMTAAPALNRLPFIENLITQIVTGKHMQLALLDRKYTGDFFESADYCHTATAMAVLCDEAIAPISRAEPGSRIEKILTRLEIGREDVKLASEIYEDALGLTENGLLYGEVSDEVSFVAHIHGLSMISGIYAATRQGYRDTASIKTALASLNSFTRAGTVMGQMLRQSIKTVEEELDFTGKSNVISFPGHNAGPR